MTKQEVEQRIRYLVEHGGLYEDPIEDVRRGVRWLRWIAGLIALGVILEIAMDLMA